ARRASYQVRQTFRYEYPQPICDLSHRLIVIPPERFGDQRRLAHNVSVGLDGARLESRTDRFGNMIVDVFAPQVADVIEFVAEVSVERRAAQPNRLADGWLADGYLLQPSRLTEADDVILRAAAAAHACDPTHASRGGLGYVTVAVGADYSDVAPTSGTYRSGSSGTLTASKRVTLMDLE